MNRPLNVVVGVTGGIAAYKTVQVVRDLVLAGHTVRVIATDAALRFVGAPTWEAISRQPLNTSIFDDVAAVRHVALGQQADVVVIAPATANTIAKLAAGWPTTCSGRRCWPAARPWWWRPRCTRRCGSIPRRSRTSKPCARAEPRSWGRTRVG